MFLLGTALLLICSGCSCQHEFREADCRNPEVCVLCGETRGETLPHVFKEADCRNPEICSQCGELRGDPLPHTFGDWQYEENRMHRSCTVCGQTEQKELTDEERFHMLMQGHWELHTVTLLTKTTAVNYLRNSFWSYSADYDGKGTLICTTAMEADKPEDFTYPVAVTYSHFDRATNTHQASGTFEDGVHLQITLEETDTEPLLHLKSDKGKLFFNPCTLSKYQQVLPIALGTWSNISSNQIIYITLLSDWTFTGCWGGSERSGTWLLSPSSGSLCGLQIFYSENGKNIMCHGGLEGRPVNNQDSEQNPDACSLWIQTSKHYAQSFRKIPQEELLPIMNAGNQVILGTWDSKSVRTYAGNDTKRYLVTDYTLTVNEDGTFTLVTDRRISGTWILRECNGFDKYSYTFTSSAGDTYEVSCSGGELSFGYRTQSKYTTYLSFVQYDEDQWTAYLAGPELLPGNYASRKITWKDKDSGEPMEREETGYRLTILPDGTVTGILHQPVTGTWFYNNLVDEGYSYIFWMDHTPPEQLSIRKEDGTLEFETRINSEMVTIYFDPQ